MLLFIYHIVFAQSKHRLMKVMILIKPASARSPNVWVLLSPHSGPSYMNFPFIVPKFWVIVYEFQINHFYSKTGSSEKAKCSP